MTDTEEKAVCEQQDATKEAGDSAPEKTAKQELESDLVQEKGDTQTDCDTSVVKSEETLETQKEDMGPTPLESKIIRQIEYYFGDANLEKDKFLKEEMKKDEGWVPLTVLLTFNRLKALSDDSLIIMTALKKSTTDLLELKADNSAIRRHPTRPLPSADNQQDLHKRILYVKGFPTELQLDDLIEYFDKYGGESVALRRDAKRLFKGSVFIRFKTEEQAKLFLEPEEMKYKDTPLLKRMYKNDYFKMKQQAKFGVKREEVKKTEEMKKKKEQEEKEEFEARIVRGALLKVAGLATDCPLEKLKEFFGEFGKVAWVDYNKGEDHAIIRFGNENEAKSAWEKAVAAGTDGKVMYNEKELSSGFIEGEEEEKHWKKVFESMRNKYQNKGGKKFGRGGHRGGRGGFKRRNAGGDSSETTAKKSKEGGS
ncbi:la protein homolog [Watersipora subatra]|uniref:la protein homolog n=1 Tax=Watersipora subatra TaxID=2589382 RepID=UPI00355C3AA9